MPDHDTRNDDRELAELLRACPAPAADEGFYDRALARATHVGSRRQRNRWLATGFASALAAGLAFWMVGTTLLTGPGDRAPAPEIPGVTMALEEPRTINLVFSSATALDAAILTVSLPAGIELEGFPGQREISWETSLAAGRNVLPLTLVALAPAGGELLARLEHQNRDRTFRLRVDIS
jgi:cellulose synthase/poly-beta-1,6-N-acetylglucosamine synthase-like glycosyltransferase